MSGNDLILLVEDNPADAMAVEAAFRELPKRFRLFHVSDGLVAVQYLSGSGPYIDRKAYPVPKLILLDLVMPGMDGFEVLEWVREQEPFKNLPVVVLAGTSTSPEIRRAYSSGANSFITKLPSVQDLRKELGSTLEYWVPQSGKLPGPPPGSLPPPSAPGASRLFI